MINGVIGMNSIRSESLTVEVIAMKEPKRPSVEQLEDTVAALQEDSIDPLEYGLEFDAAGRCTTAYSHPARIRYERMKDLVMLYTAQAVYAKWCTRPNNGIHGIPGNKNVVLIEGSCITINWDATELEVEQALVKWREIRKS